MSSLSDVALLIVDCEHKTAPKSDTGFPLIRTTDLGRAQIDFRRAQRIDAGAYAQWTRRATPSPGDVILAREAPVGPCGIVPEGEAPVLGQRTVLIRPNPALIDPRFLCYLLAGDEMQEAMLAIANGSTTPHLNIEDIRGLTLPVLPALRIQRRAADLLEAFDDLIENNRRRIEILEETSRALYREWLVCYRLPGDEPEDFSRGRLPAGWMVRPLGDICRLATTSADPRVGNPYLPAVGLEHIPRRSTTLCEWGSAGELASRKLCFQPGDVLFGKIRPYFHKVAMAPMQGVCSTDVIILRSNDDWLVGLVLAVASSDEFVAQAVQTSNGTKMPRADWQVLAEYPVAIPAGLMGRHVSESLAASAWLASALAMQNRALSAARNLLLPKLMTGKIVVERLGVDKLFGWAELASTSTAAVSTTAFAQSVEPCQGQRL